MAATFSDEFTEAGGGASTGALLKNHTPNTGTGWSWVGTNDDGFRIRGGSTGDIALSIGGLSGAIGVGYDEIVPGIGSADHQAWAKFDDGWNETTGSAHLCVRLVDEDNQYGLHATGSGAVGLQFSKWTGGTEENFSQSQPTAGYWYRVKADGTTITAWTSGSTTEPTDPEEDTNWTQIGLDQTSQTDHQTEQSVGVANRSGDQSRLWIDAYRAHTIPAAAPGGVSIAALAARSTVTIGGGAPA